MTGILLLQGVAVAFLAYYILLPIIEYYKDPKKLRRFPSISVAAFTDAWMVIQQYCYSRTVAVHRAHLKSGPIVRIGTSHISMASQQAIKDIYGHGTPATKDNFYKAYVGTHLNVSDSQDRGVHSHKRKRFAVAFAQKTITDLEYAVAEKLKKLMLRLDEYAHESSSSSTTSTTVKQSEDLINLKSWIACLALDINGVLLFSHEFGFLDQGNTVTIAERIGGSTYRADIKMAISESNRISTSLAWAPRGLSLNRFITGWHSGWKHGAALRDVTIHCIRKRLKREADRVAQGGKRYDDYFSTLLWDRKTQQPLGLEFGELVAEASNLLTAGSENIEISTTGVIYHLARNPRAAAKLQEELDLHVSLGADDQIVPAYDEIKDLPYLRACIDESLRLRAVLPIGLPRVVPPEGMLVDGQWLEGNTTVSVSTYTVHRDPEYFPNPDEYRPERWLEPGAAELQKVFLAFQQGGRACLGKNIAYLELQMIVATLVKRYEFSLPTPEWELQTCETIMGHTGELPVKISSRA